MAVKILDGVLYGKLIVNATANLNIHSEEINNLNVFPIPDGDTGSNMLLTMEGGKNAINSVEANLSQAANTISDGMLLCARGNSGVILSQFFNGISAAFTNLENADMEQIKLAFKEGVKHAYEAVMTPVEGTILTVLKDATEYACRQQSDTILGFIESFIEEAKLSLEHTPELLPVLKKAGVVDSGGAGLVYIMDGMRQFLRGETVEGSYETTGAVLPESSKSVNLDSFTSDSVLEFGYCTELLLRLQNKKTDVENFSVDTIKAYLDSIGNSVVAFKTGSIIKLHVHTMTPDKVLAFCQQFGEFLTVKIENMSLQHNSIVESSLSGFKVPKPSSPEQEKKAYGIVVVASGEGLKNMFLEHGADYVVDGGQSMNPSSEDFLTAFNSVKAQTIFVFPNNGNVILAARQAANMYDGTEIKVVESTSIGEGYAALMMMDTSCNDTELILNDINGAMQDVSTYYVSHCVRDAEIDGITMKNGDYIGFENKKILVSTPLRKQAAIQTIDCIAFEDHEVFILIRGADSTNYEEKEIKAYLNQKHPDVEVYEVDGNQDVYSYIFIVE